MKQHKNAKYPWNSPTGNFLRDSGKIFLLEILSWVEHPEPLRDWAKNARLDLMSKTELSQVGQGIHHSQICPFCPKMAGDGTAQTRPNKGKLLLLPGRGVCSRGHTGSCPVPTREQRMGSHSPKASAQPSPCTVNGYPSSPNLPFSPGVQSEGQKFTVQRLLLVPAVCHYLWAGKALPHSG